MPFSHHSTNPYSPILLHTPSQDRVFIHPASRNFGVGEYACPWLVYYEKAETGGGPGQQASEMYDSLHFIVCCK